MPVEAAVACTLASLALVRNATAHTFAKRPDNHAGGAHSRPKTGLSPTRQSESPTRHLRGCKIRDNRGIRRSGVQAFRRSGVQGATGTEPSTFDDQTSAPECLNA